jgi:hypothetical protein
MAVKTLLGALKQKFLVHPVDVVEQDINTVKTTVETDVAKVEAVPAKVTGEAKQLELNLAQEVKDHLPTA